MSGMLFPESSHSGAASLVKCWLRLAFTISIAAVLGAPSLVEANDVDDARLSIQAADLRSHIEFLASDTIEGRKAGSEGGQAAAAYLASQFRSYGLEPEKQGFRQEFKAGNDDEPITMRNVIARWAKPGDEQKPIVVSAHFDHVGMGGKGTKRENAGQIHNGADDNASGTALVLELAQACSRLPAPSRPVLFALWDGEEQGLVGSTRDAKAREKAKNLPALSIVCDMIGRASCNRVYIFGIDTVARLESVVNGSADKLQSTNPLEPIYIRKHLPRSDHWPFFKRAVPYLFFHTGLHENYHRPGDDANLVNYETAESISRLAFDVLIKVLENDMSLELVESSNDLPMTNLPPHSTCDDLNAKSEEKPGVQEVAPPTGDAATAVAP